MRKIILKFVLLLLVVLSVTAVYACDGKESDSSVTTTKTEENLKETIPALPVEKLEEQKSDKGKIIYNRWYEGESPTLIPRDDYGPLVPFIGMCKNYTRFAAEGGADDLSYYGVMTTDGRVVVDPIYPSVFFIDLDNGERVLYFNSYVDSGYEFEYGSAVAAADGSWVIDLGKNGMLEEHKDNKLIISFYDSENIPSRMEVYDYNGNLLFEIDGYRTDRAFNSGYVPVYNTIGDNSKFRIIDEKGNFVFGEYDYASEFENGYLLVEKNGLYGVIDTNGKWFINPIYKEVESYDGKYFRIALPGNKYIIVDENKKKVTSYRKLEDDFERYYRYYGGQLIYRCDDIYKYAETDEPVVCKENGLEAEMTYKDNWFCASDDNGNYFIFDVDGNLIETITGTGYIYDVGEYVNYYKRRTYSGDGKGVLTVHEKKTDKAVYEVCYEKDEDGGVYVFEEAGLILMSKVKGDYYFTNRQIFDIRSGKVIFEDFIDCDVVIVDGKLFISVCDENYIEVYNGNLDVILRYPNE